MFSSFSFLYHIKQIEINFRLLTQRIYIPFSKTRLFKHETKYYAVLCSSTRCEREWDSCRNNEFSQCTSKCSKYATMHLYIHEAYHEALCMLVNNTRFVSYKRYENSGFIDDFCLFLFFLVLTFLKAKLFRESYEK